MVRRAKLAAGLLVAAVVLAGCAPTHSTLRYQPDPPFTATWPAPPETPRYRYVGELTGEQNIHVPNQGFASSGTRLFKWLVGLTSPKHEAVVLQRPQGGVTDPAGRVYVTDVSRQAVYVFDEPAGTLQVWEMAGDNVRFVSPIGIALGADGEILVADAELGYVVRLGKDGKPRGVIGRTQLVRPTGVARDAARGRIYVADTHGHAIKVFSDSGELLKTFGQRGEALGEFNSPTYLSFADNRLYVTDTLNARVQVLSADGDALQVFGRRGIFMGDMPRPKGVAVDKAGNVYVVESYFDYLLVFNPEGELLLPIGGTGGGLGQFYLPAGVWTDERDWVYIADSFNGRVVILQFLREGA
ncbi:MAG: 6-bladed beta-propeller [Pseudomonadota bacterium]